MYTHLTYLFLQGRCSSWRGKGEAGGVKQQYRASFPPGEEQLEGDESLYFNHQSRWRDTRGGKESYPSTRRKSEFPLRPEKPTTTTHLSVLTDVNNVITTEI